MVKILSLFHRRNTGDSLTSVVSQHLDSLYRQAYRYCGNEADAEDLLQDLMLECSQRNQQLQEAPVPAAWLNRVLYHRFVDRHRKQARHLKGREDLNSTIDTSLAANDEPEDAYSHHQLLLSLEELSPDQRMIINLHDIEGYTLAEVSATTSIPVGTLKSHLHRGRRKLKNKLQPNID